MEKKKTKSAPIARKAASKAAVERRAVREVAVVATSANNSNRLLREAAWSRMFGRVELKNPFTR